MNYSISQFSRMLGVSVDSLRHYERCGLLHPHINPQNGYRTYTDADALQVFHIRMCRGLNMSIPQIAELSGPDSFEREQEFLRSEMDRLNAQMMRLQLLQNRYKARLHATQRVRQTGRVSAVALPPVFHLFYGDFPQEGGREAESMLRTWTEAMPFTSFLLMLELPEVLSGGPIRPKLGLSARLNTIEEFSLPIRPPARMRMGGPGVQMPVALKDPFSISRETLSPMFSFAREQGWEISGDVSCIVDDLEYRPDGMYCYLFLRFPVRTDKK